MICNKCNGSGQQPVPYKLTFLMPSVNKQMITKYTYTCKNCHGTGEVDWIENITGKKGDIDIDMYLKYSFEGVGYI